MRLYLAVTSDEYELPLDFDESPSKLASRLGISVNNLHVKIRSRKVHPKALTMKGSYRVYIVEIPQGEVDE